LRKRSDEVNALNQTVARLQQELTDTKSTLLKKNEELATITEDLGAKEALLTDCKNKELQVSINW
jgi:hypothetical protein